MSQKPHVSILVVEDSRVISEVVRQILQREGYEVSVADSAEDAYDQVIQYPFDLLVTDLVLPGMDGYSLCRKLRQQPQTRTLPILMLTSQSDTAAKIAGIEAGVDDYLVKPFQPEELAYRVKGLLTRAKAAKQQLLGGEGAGRTVAFFGTKGGVGKTTLAVNFAVALQRRSGRAVALFDADFFFGDVSVQLNLPSVRNILDLIKYIDELDADLANQVLTPHASGVRALLNPFHPEEAELISPEHVSRLVTFLSGLYAYVVIDCQPSYDDRMLTILDMADEIMLVITPEIGPIKNTSQFLNLARKLGIPLEKVHLILNRANSEVGIAPAEIERTLQHKVAFQMVSGGRPVVLSVNRGAPLVSSQPDHPLSQQIMRMVDLLVRGKIRG